MVIDIYGREWKISLTEACPICYQPDNSDDCNHEKLTDDEVALLQGE